MGTVTDFDCWYDNGFGAGKWQVNRKDGLVAGCILRFTDEKLELHNGKQSVYCPWPAVNLKVATSDRGNAILTVGMLGPAGGTSRIIVPGYAPNAIWAELWRVATPMRSRMEAAKPVTISAPATHMVQFDYMGGYSLHPVKSFVGVWVVMDQFGTSVLTGVRKHRQMLLAWKDIPAISIEGMMDVQRRRSLARTIEFGTLGGLAGKKTRSAYLTVTTTIGEAVFHTERMTVPELRSVFGHVASQVQNMAADRTRALSPKPVPAASSVADELAKLAKLRDGGVLTDEEFAAQKAKLLG